MKCTVAYTGQFTFYKVPEQHGHVYQVELNVKNIDAKTIYPPKLFDAQLSRVNMWYILVHPHSIITIQITNLHLLYRTVIRDM